MQIELTVIGKDGDHNASFVTKGDFEGRAFVVKFFGVFPTHAGGFLILCGFADVRQADVLLFQCTNMSCSNDGMSVIFL